jgi:hypothetical protein
MPTTDHRTSPAEVRYAAGDVRAFDDWRAITTGLINEAREPLMDDEPATASAR